MTESGSPSDSVRCGAALVGLFILVATITAFAPGYAAQPITLKVEATHGLPGLHHSALSRFLATHMAEVGLADWRFVPAAGDASAPDRVEWTIRLNPYAGGEVRNFVRTLFSEQRLGVHRPVTIEAGLYLNGQYQTLVQRQAVIQGGPDDPDLVRAGLERASRRDLVMIDEVETTMGSSGGLGARNRPCLGTDRCSGISGKKQ